MRAVLTRVSSAELTVNGEKGPSIKTGFLILVGIKEGDSKAQCDYLAEKCARLRIFEDENGKMNKSCEDVDGSFMIVSNFTLYADCSHGRRPDFFGAAKPDISEPLYDYFVEKMRTYGRPVVTGSFGADMKIDHVNDGPVTLIMDTDLMMKA